MFSLVLIFLNFRDGFFVFSFLFRLSFLATFRFIFFATLASGFATILITHKMKIIIEKYSNPSFPHCAILIIILNELVTSVATTGKRNPSAANVAPSCWDQKSTSRSILEMSPYLKCILHFSLCLCFCSALLRRCVRLRKQLMSHEILKKFGNLLS